MTKPLAPTLDIVGCGRVGRALGRAWQRAGVLRIQHVLTRSPASAERAVAFLGAGRPVEDPADLAPADVVLIATSDDAIADVCASLVAAGVIRRGDVVFHVSGALGSDALAAARDAGACVASVHPVMSFADPEAASRSLDGVHCGAEGDEAALAVLRPAFEALGARLFAVDPARKGLYHAGAVIACNYLVTLVEQGLRCYEGAGVPRERAMHVLLPLVRGTVENVARSGPVAALTGPVARGEVAVVRGHLEQLARFDPELAALYRALGAATLALAGRQGTASAEDLDELARLLAGDRAAGRQE